MSFFEFPHTRTYDSDLGWLIRAFKQLNVDVDNLQDWAASHQPEYEELQAKVEGLINQLVDVIVPWDSSVEYPIYSIVEYQGSNYIAVKPVPVGTMITNTDYWQPANTTVEQINAIGATVTELSKTAANYYVTPQMFGAVGDGVTDDTAAFQAAAAAIREHIYKKDYSDGGPSEYVGGYEFYIPGGTYILTGPVEIPSNGVTHGAGRRATILRFTGSSYGLSLSGDPYNGLRYWHGTVRDLSVVMDGNGVGISNIEHCNSTSAGQNAVVGGLFENLQVMRADTGIAIIGGWNTQIISCNIQFCLIGVLEDRLNGVNGNNNNSIINTAATSCVMAAFWLSMAGAYLENINAESVGDTWPEHYTGQTVTYCGTAYSVEYPAGVYLHGVCRMQIHGLWLERITELQSDSSQMYGVLINTEVVDGHTRGDINIYGMHINTDVHAPIRTLSECALLVDTCYWNPTSAAYNLALIDSSTFGVYRFRNITEYLAGFVHVTGKTAYNSVTFENVRSFGAQGNFRLYTKSDTQTYNVLDWQKFAYVPDSSYDVSYRTRVTTSNKRLTQEVNSKPILEMGYDPDHPALFMPTNVQRVTVEANAATVKIPFNSSYHSDTAPAGVTLSANNAAGAALLAGGYYWSASDITNNTLTVTFVNPAASAVTLDAFVYKK